MSTLAAIKIVIHGHVQGVFFRAFVLEKAAKLGLTGYVCNLASGQDIEILAEGEKEKLQKLIELLKIGPPLSRVDGIKTTWSKYNAKFAQFAIRY